MARPGTILILVLLLNCAMWGGAQTSSSSSQPGSKRSSQQVPTIAPGSISDGVYRNPSFGFSYKIPFGWVDRTEVMQQSDSAEPAPQPGRAQVLLAVFERPPEARRSAINSGVVIAVEPASSYPGLKEAADYFGPLEQVTTAKGYKVVNEPYEFPVGQREVAREDFNNEAGEITMHQSCLVIAQKGYIVSFTFIADRDDAMDELIQGLSFFSGPASSKPHTTPAKKQPSAPR